MAKYYPFGATTYNLGTSIGSTDTTIILSSFLEPVTGVPYTMTLLNTDIVFATIAPKTTSSEFISFTGITQNANGTATLTGVSRGLAKKYPFASDAAYKLPHSGQSQFIISDAPQVFQEYVSNVNDQIVAGIKTFSSSPLVPDPTTSLQVSNKEYVDNIAIAGAPDASTTVKGIGKVSVAPVSPTSPIFVGDNDGRVPTQAENDALVGNNTDIAVGSSNKFVTQTGLIHGAETYAITTGSANAYILALAPIIASYTAGMLIKFTSNFSNTGATTINVNSLGAKSIVKNVNTALVSGDIASGMSCTAEYDGTNFVLQNPVSNSFTAALTPSYSKVSTLTISSVSVLTATTTVVGNFTSLDGNTDDIYLIVLELAATGGNSSGFTIRCNSDSTSNYTYLIGNMGATYSSLNSSGTATQIQIQGASLTTVFGTILVKANQTYATASTIEFIVDTLNPDTVSHGAGRWASPTGNLTSLQLLYTQTSGSTQTVTGLATIYKINR